MLQLHTLIPGGSVPAHFACPEVPVGAGDKTFLGGAVLEETNKLKKNFELNK